MDAMADQEDEDLTDLEGLDDEDFLAAMEAEDREAAALLMEWLGDDMPRRLPRAQRRDAVKALRAGITKGTWPHDWFARSLSWQGGVPADLDDEAAWLRAAGSVVSPPEDPGWDTEAVGAVMSLTHADWIAAVLALVRQGAGSDASPQALARKSMLVPEIEGEIDPADIGLVEHAFEVVTPLWQALGAVDEQRRVTRLGCWGMPRAFWLTWGLSGLTHEGLMVEAAADDPTGHDEDADEDADEGDDLEDDAFAASQREWELDAEPARRAFLDWQLAPQARDDSQGRTSAAALSEPGAANWLETAVHRSPDWDPFLRWAFAAALGTGAAAGPARYLALRAEWETDSASEESWLAAALAADPQCGPALWRMADYAGDRGDAATAYDLLRRAEVDNDDEELATYSRFRFPPTATAPRNAPCPCGSGRKYKHCHGGQRIGHPLVDRAGWLLAKVGRYVQRPPQQDLVMSYGALLAGTDDIRSREAVAAAISQPFVTDAAMFDGGALADFLDERGSLLPVDERELAASWVDTRVGLYEVTDVTPGSGMRMRDLADDHEQVVTERIGSHEVSPGALLLTRLLDNGAGQMLGPVMLISRWQRASLSAALEVGSAGAVLGWLADAGRLPELRNTEDHELVSATAQWRLSSAQSWRRLRDSGLVENGPDNLILQRPSGTVVGTFSRTRLVVEISTNSVERLQELVDLLNEADPDAAFLSGSERSAADMIRTPRVVRQPEELDQASADALAEYVHTYERQWIDTEIPALDGMTPRAALRTPAARRKLQLLLEDFDAMPRPSGGIGMDADRIRVLLGLPRHR